ncbi:MAG: hypothetical protein AUK48_09730 [Oscillatoriales cyanobacterium CG2_30_44_21]|nr:MAG: hypothetical protein AUK48_09730 [Oscillatoriales cyanobacterium CG2_30_44_21]
MKFFTTVFALTLPLVCAVSELLPSGLWNREAIAQSKTLIVQSQGTYQSDLNRLVQRGDAKFAQKDFKAAIAIYQKALGLAQKNQDYQSQVTLLAGIGRVYDLDGQYINAESSFNKGWQVLSQADKEFATVEKRSIQSRLRVMLLSGWGITYSNLGDYAKASEKLQLAVSVSSFEARKPTLLISFEPRLELAELHEKQKKYQEAVSVLQSARLIANQIGDRRAEAMALTAIGNNIAKLGNLNAARQYYDQAESLGSFPEEPKIANDAKRVADASGDLAGLSNLFDRFVPVMQKASISIRKLERILSIEPSFTIIGRTANNLESVTETLISVTPKLRNGDLMGAYPTLQGIQSRMTEMSQNLKELQALMMDVKANPRKYPSLQRLSPQNVKDLQNIMEEMRDIANSIGGKSKELKKNKFSLKPLKKN